MGAGPPIGGLPGRIYPVSARGGEPSGLRIRPSLHDIDDEIDYAIASVPYRAVFQLIDECAAKDARIVQFFTAGFRETGRDEGAALERELLRKAERVGLRLIGPNCIGSYCPEARLPLGPSALGRVGEPVTTAFISQSGGGAAKLVEYGIA